MTTNNDTASTANPTLLLHRTGTRQYIAKNSRGAEVQVGQGPGQWSPGELLKLALLGCNAMSADSRLAALLGDDFELSGGIDGDFNDEEDRYQGFTVELIPDFSEASSEDIEKTIERALRAIERHCTVAHTLDHVVPHSTVITNE